MAETLGVSCVNQNKFQTCFRQSGGIAWHISDSMIIVMFARENLYGLFVTLYFFGYVIVCCNSCLSLHAVSSCFSAYAVFSCMHVCMLPSTTICQSCSNLVE